MVSNDQLVRNLLDWIATAERHREHFLTEGSSDARSAFSAAEYHRGAKEAFQRVLESLQQESQK